MQTYMSCKVKETTNYIYYHCILLNIVSIKHEMFKSLRLNNL